MSKSETVQCVLLGQKAEIKQVKVALNNGTLSMDIVKQFLKKKETPQILGKYPYKNQTLTLFGFSNGKAGSENKHELPPPLDSQLYFGDILVIACKNSDDYRQAIPLTTQPMKLSTLPHLVDLKILRRKKRKRKKQMLKLKMRMMVNKRRTLRKKLKKK
jgi:hypothetical protein